MFARVEEHENSAQVIVKLKVKSYFSTPSAGIAERADLIESANSYRDAQLVGPYQGGV